jgi:hypothetical protein
MLVDVILMKEKVENTYNGIARADNDIGIDVPLVVGGLATRVAPEGCQAGVCVLLEKVGRIILGTPLVLAEGHFGVPGLVRHSGCRSDIEHYNECLLVG